LFYQHLIHWILIYWILVDWALSWTDLKPVWKPMSLGHYARFIRFWIRIATTDRRAIAFLFLYCQFLDTAFLKLVRHAKDNEILAYRPR